LPAAAIFRVLGASSAGALSTKSALLECVVRAVPAAGAKSTVANTPGIAPAAYLSLGDRSLDNGGGHYERQACENCAAHVSLHMFLFEPAGYGHADQAEFRTTVRANISKTKE
jgi:hypothetical protein